MEFLVRVVDHLDQPDPTLRLQRCGAGDIVDFRPDGWAWSANERTKNEWRIIRVNVLQSTVEALDRRIYDLNGKIVKRREFYIDLALLPSPSRFTGTRVDEIITLTRSQVVNAIKQRT